MESAGITGRPLPVRFAEKPIWNRFPLLATIRLYLIGACRPIPPAIFSRSTPLFSPEDLVVILSNEPYVDGEPQWRNWVLERRHDGVILVRVPSNRSRGGEPLPDAVFSFRDGDPQYGLWSQRAAERSGKPAS